MKIFNYINLSNYKKLIIKEVSVQLLEKIARILVGLIVVKSLSFYLGPAKYGILNFIESYYLLIYGISTFGLDTVITKRFVLLKGKKNFKDLISSGIIILSTIAIIIYLINLLVLFNFIDFGKEKLIIVICFLLFFNPFLLVEHFLTSKNQIRYISIIRLTAYLISSLLKLTAIYLKLELDYFVYIIMLESILLYVGFIILIRKRIKLNSLSLKINFKLIKEILIEGLPIFLYALGTLVYSRIDIFMIQRYLTDTDLGNYSASFKLVAFLLFLPGILSASFFPKIVFESSLSLNSFYIQKMYRYSFYMSVCLLIFCLFAGPIMIDVLFGTQYESSLLLYNLLIFILITSSIGAVYTKVIYSVNLQARLLLRSITGIVINISLNYFLIKYYGVLGTAFATLISLFIIEIIYDFLDYKLRPFHIFKLKSILFIKSNH
jgi:O-antigen/teichoic acid export membrane protein